MRILIYNWRDWEHPMAGGAEIYTHRVAEEWVQQGHEVTLFCAGSPGLSDLDISDGVTIIRRGGRFGVYNEARKFYEEEGKGKFDLVIDEVNTRPFMAPSFVTDAPVIALIHQVAKEVWFHETAFPFNVAGRYFLEKKWLRAYRNVPTVTVSESSKDSLHEYGLENVTVVPEGMSMPDVAADFTKEESPTVIFCGRLSPNKRPDHAVEAFRWVRDHIPNAKMWVVGTGKMLATLERRKLDGVSFLGRVSHQQKFELMGRAHALVATSVREGWGLVVSEAAAMGTLAFGYDVAGLRDSVKASSGELVAPRPDALGKRLVEVLPQIVQGVGPKPIVGGVASWSLVAEEILAAAGFESTRTQTDNAEVAGEAAV